MVILRFGCEGNSTKGLLLSYTEQPKEHHGPQSWAMLSHIVLLCIAEKHNWA